MNSGQDSFSKFIWISLAFHGVIFLLLVIRVVFFPQEDLAFEPAVRIDMVALPEKQSPKTPPKPPQKEKKTRKVVIKEKKPKEPKKKLEKKKASSSKKALEDKKRQKAQETALERLKALQKQKQKKPPEYKGNALSEGSQLVGLEKLHHESYHGELQSYIKSHWNLPEWLASASLEARVRIKIGKNGEIREKVFMEKSGNEVFDQQVLAALDQSNPLPPPPLKLRSYYATQGVYFQFP